MTIVSVLDEYRDLDEIQIRLVNALASSFSPVINTETMFQRAALVQGTQQFLESLRKQRAPHQKNILVEFLNAFDRNPALKNVIGSVEFTGANGTIIPIPNEFEGMLKQSDQNGTGCGESLLPLFLKNPMSCNEPNSLHDFTICIDGAWVNCGLKDSSGLLSAQGKAKNKTSRTTHANASDPFKRSSIIKWLDGLGYDLTDIKVKKIAGNEDFECAVIERYGLPLAQAAIAFEKELQAAFKLSHVIEHGMWFIEWINDRAGGQRCFRYADKDNIFFSGYDKMGFLITCKDDRFEKAILSRTSAILVAEQKEFLKQENAKNAADKLAASRLRKEFAKALKMESIEKKNKLEAEKFAEFVSVVSSCHTKSQVAKVLKASTNKVKKFFEKAQAAGLIVELKRKELKKKNANANRNRSRKHETNDQGPLELDTESIQGERRRELTSIVI